MSLAPNSSTLFGEGAGGGGGGRGVSKVHPKSLTLNPRTESRRALGISFLLGPVATSLHQVGLSSPPSFGPC